MEREVSKTISTQTDFNDISTRNEKMSQIEETEVIIKGYYKGCGFKEINTDEEKVAEKKIKTIVKELLELADEFDKEKKLEKIAGSSNIKTLNKTIFDSIADQIFETGKSWGKIVVLLLLGAKVAWMAASGTGGGNQGQLILQVVEWVTSYIIKNLMSWITESGGWIAIKEFVDETKISLEDPEKRTKTLVYGSGLVVAGVAIVAGLYYIFKND